MLKSTCKTVLNIVAPKIYASLKLSRACRSFPEDELHIAPLLCDKAKTSIDIGACGGIYTSHIVDASRDCLAFEPNPNEFLQTNRNDNEFVIACPGRNSCSFGFARQRKPSNP